MLHTFFNWLTFDTQNLIPEVWWCCLILWSVLLIIAFSDVVSNTLKPGTKFAWILAILLVPFGGLLAYCTFSLYRADYYMLEFLIKKRKNPRSARLRALNSTPTPK